MEKNPRIAWNINVTALSRFLNTAEKVDRFFYPSSDSVYGESVNGHRFTEHDSLLPVNRYGVQKSCAEKLVTAYGYNVVRFPFLIGPSLVEGKKHFYDTILESITSGRPIDMFRDSYRSALDFDTAARLLVEIMEKPAEEVPQILNICGDEALSKYEIGLKLAKRYNVSSEMIHPVSIHDDTGIFAVKRAACTLMDNSIAKRILGLGEIKMSFHEA